MLGGEISDVIITDFILVKDLAKRQVKAGS